MLSALWLCGRVYAKLNVLLAKWQEAYFARDMTFFSLFYLLLLLLLLLPRICSHCDICHAAMQMRAKTFRLFVVAMFYLSTKMLRLLVVGVVIVNTHTHTHSFAHEYS